MLTKHLVLCTAVYCLFQVAWVHTHSLRGDSNTDPDFVKELLVRPMSSSATLKVPKREIFDRSDFSDFYTIKSSWVGDLVVKILTIILIFVGAMPHLVSDAHAAHTRKELMRMLSMRISS